MTTEVLQENKKEQDVEDVSTEIVSTPANQVIIEHAEPTIKISKIDAVKNELNAIEQKYQKDYPEFDESVFSEKGLDFKEVKNFTETDVQNDAVEDLQDFRDVNVDKIENKFNETNDTLNLKEQVLNDELTETKQQIEEAKVEDLEIAQAENIANGVAVSSIADNKEKRIIAGVDKELEIALNKTNIALAEIALKRGVAESEFQNAIQNFDITYANKLENRINELNKEYTKAQAQAVAYNEKIEKQREIAYQEWKRKAEAETSKLDAKKGHEKAVLVINQLKTMSRKEALEFLKDTDILTALGGWYTAVYDYIDRNLK